jgi:hypothetical protein
MEKTPQSTPTLVLDDKNDDKGLKSIIKLYFVSSLPSLLEIPQIISCRILILGNPIISAMFELKADRKTSKTSWTSRIFILVRRAFGFRKTYNRIGNSKDDKIEQSRLLLEQRSSANKLNKMFEQHRKDPYSPAALPATAQLYNIIKMRTD